MISEETIINYSNNSEALKDAKLRIQKKLDELKESKQYNKSDSDFVNYYYLMSLQRKVDNAFQKSFKLHF